MSSLLYKILLIYLCIGLVLQVGGVPNRIASDLVGDDASLSTGIAGSLPNVNEETGAGTGILSFIDALKAIRNFLIFVGGVVTALPEVLLDLQTPEIVRMLLGIPLTIAAIMALIQMARSGS